MNDTNFCFWLHGLFEIGEPEILVQKQVQEIKNHLDLVNNSINNNYTFLYPENLRQWNINHPNQLIIC